MQTTYAQKNETIQKASANTAESVVDSSSQSATLQRHASLANAAVQRAENPPRPNNTGLPDDLKNGVESLSGYSLDNVRVHYNSPKPATVQALAYTQGTDIHVAPGQEHALPHEAWHVTQQMAGRVTPTTNIGGMPVNDNAALEHEADVMGEKAVQCKREGEGNEGKTPKMYSGNKIVQMRPNGECDMVCAADVLYQMGGEEKRVKGVGYNNSTDREKVNKVFENRELVKLGKDLRKVGEGNEPGQCAEPHAFANALEKDGNIKAADILDVFISEAVIRKLPNRETELAITNVSTGEIKGSIKTYSRCETCAQWIQADGHVKPSYLEKENRDDLGVVNYSKVDSLKLKKHIEIRDGKMIFGEKEFNNVKFLEQTIVHLPDWFKNDDEIKGIDGCENLRTVIKKQLLKNRLCEIESSVIKDILILQSNCAYDFPDNHMLKSQKFSEDVENYKAVLKKQKKENTSNKELKVFLGKLMGGLNESGQIPQPGELEKLKELDIGIYEDIKGCVKLDDYKKKIKSSLSGLNKPDRSAESNKKCAGSLKEDILKKVKEEVTDTASSIDNIAENAKKIRHEEKSEGIGGV